jgi:CRP-like cAMP-binding protein
MTGKERAHLEGHAFLAGLPEGTLELVADLAQPMAFVPGQLLAREGTLADLTYMITSGHVAIELHAPHRGPLVVETLSAGSVVGLSWSAPPFRYGFDVRALDDVQAAAIDATRLRAALAANPALGLPFVERLTGVILDRLQATRIRLLDLYGHAGVD